MYILKIFLREQCRKLGKSYSNNLAFYAYKANSNTLLCRIIHKEGLGVEVISKGELILALSLDLSPDKIVFSGVSKSDEEIGLSVNEKLFMINIESIQEIEMMSKIAKELNKRVQVGIRLNVGIA